MKTVPVCRQQQPNRPVVWNENKIIFEKHWIMFTVFFFWIALVLCGWSFNATWLEDVSFVGMFMTFSYITIFAVSCLTLSLTRRRQFACLFEMMTGITGTTLLRLTASEKNLNKLTWNRKLRCKYELCELVCFKVMNALWCDVCVKEICW